MILYCLSLLSLLGNTDSLQTPHEKSKGTKTSTYTECIAYYEKLDRCFEEIKVVKGDSTDGDDVLRLVVVNSDKQFDLPALRKSKKAILFINNGIHPGEPEGIDASMALARDLVRNKSYRRLLDSVIVCIVPVFNIEGSQNTSPYYRANQNGPDTPAFRGNGQNRDLNRDFIKLDTRNTKALVRFIQQVQPDVFIDNHTSNGADYQYVLTYIATQKDKLNPALAAYMTRHFQPQLDARLTKKGFAPSPYVNEYKSIPDSGISAFLETPRYSTGYTTLFNVLGFVVETHMLKPFSQRVQAIYAFLQACLEGMREDCSKLKKLHREADSETAQQERFPINYTLDTTRHDQLLFKGYTAGYKTSEVSGLPRLYYDRKKPFTKPIPFYDTYIATDTLKKPYAYVLPQAYRQIAHLLELNGVNVQRLNKDTSLMLELSMISDLSTGKNPFEGHYLHSKTQTRELQQTALCRKGDYVIIMDQAANRFCMEVLEPRSVDSYFNWNYFDGILSQKEYFSDYVFEDVAAELIKKDPFLKTALEAERLQNPDFAKSAAAQLDFVYRHSPYYEPSHKRYPVMRVINPVSLPLH